MPLTTPALGLLLVVLIWGGNFTAMKLAFTEIPPLPFTAVRFTIGSVLMWLLLARREGWRLPPRPTWLPLIALGIIGNTIYQLCFMTGLDRTTATNSSLILASMPTVVTVAAGALGLEEVSARQRWALAIATLGVVFVVASRGFSFEGGDLVGDMLMLAAVICWAAYTLGLRSLAGSMSTLALTTWTLITGTPGLLLAGIVPAVRLPWHAVSARGWGAFAYATLLSLVVAYVLWNRGVRQIGPSRAALFTTLTPLVATLTAVAVLGERPGWMHLAGGAMIITGVVVSRRPVRPVATPELEAIERSAS
jgi:drug/metabolite transporter (DMT)-like permease